MGFHWQKWGSLFSIRGIRGGVSLVPLMVFKMCGFAKISSRSSPPFPEVVIRIRQAPSSSPFGMGLDT